METKIRTEQPPMVLSTLENGAQLGWLIDPVERKVHVYGPEERVEISERSDNVSGDLTFPGSDLEPIREPGL